MPYRHTEGTWLAMSMDVVPPEFATFTRDVLWMDMAHVAIRAEAPHAPLQDTLVQLALQDDGSMMRTTTRIQEFLHLHPDVLRDTT